MTTENLLYTETHASDWLLRLGRLGFVLFGHALAKAGFLMMMFILHVPIMLMLRVFDTF